MRDFDFSVYYSKDGSKLNSRALGKMTNTEREHLFSVFSGAKSVKECLYCLHHSIFPSICGLPSCNNFDKNLTEVENMTNNGYMRVFDSGNAVYARGLN